MERKRREKEKKRGEANGMNLSQDLISFFHFRNHDDGGDHTFQTMNCMNRPSSWDQVENLLTYKQILMFAYWDIFWLVMWA